MHDIQHFFICRPSDFTVSEDAGIVPRTVATTALAVRRSNHSARSCMKRLFIFYKVLSMMPADTSPAKYK